MGVVYLAMDTRLERQVALKVLPQDADPDSDASRRFLREAKIASSFTHPNIVSVYDVGESPKGRFVAMEYIEGITLRRRLAKGAVGIGEAIRIARQVSEALQAAQARGIVHRDIKPENIMLLPSGHIKVLDFGLARQQLPAEAAMAGSNLPTETQITQALQIVGTAAYMSPEQLAGRAVDTRSDMFSLGVVLYEMLAGRRPFESSTSTGVMERIFNSQPDALARFNYDVPPELELIVRKCLEKDPARRYQSAQELTIDLGNLERDTLSGRLSLSSHVLREAETPAYAPPTRRWALLAGLLVAALLVGAWFWYRYRQSVSIDSIAVLPFANTGGERSLDYVSEGITDAITDDLSHIPSLRVTARSVMQRYRGQRTDPQAAGRDLNVRAVLAGEFNQQGDSVTVRSELIEVATGAQLWNQSYRRPMKDLAGLQEALCQDVASKLRIALDPSLKRNLNRRVSANSEAYQLYLKGRHHMNLRTMEDFSSAVRLFQEAVERDPSFALGYAGLADTYALIATYGNQPPASALEQTRAAAARALELDSNLSEAHVSLALSRSMIDFDWAGAEREYRRAIELDPRNTHGHLWYALMLLVPLDRRDEALIETQRAVDIEPSGLASNMAEGVVLYFSRRYEKAIDKFLAVQKIAPGFPPALLHLALAYAQTEKKNEAIRILEEPGLASRLPVETRSHLGWIYAATNRRDEARRMADWLNAQAAKGYVSPYARASAYAGMGENSKALDLLEQSYRLRDSSFRFLKVDPELDPVRGEKRLQALLKLGNFL